MELELRKFNKFVDKTFIEGGKKPTELFLLQVNENEIKGLLL